ncbi:MAG: LysR family transcriptional regulator [Halopseudomonas sp.]
MKNLPMDQLRTFVTINDLGGFTLAGEALGRSQPAISLQLKRLEDLVNVQLFDRSGGLSLTEEGQVLYNHARKILETNDAVISRLTTTTVSGSVRLGIPNDFEISYLSMMLSKFVNAYPNITLDVSSDLSSHLRQDFKKGNFDLVMTMDNHPSDEFEEGDYIVEPLRWAINPSFESDPKQPIPLVLYPKGCIYRQHITQALNKANIPWRVLYSTSSLLGILSAIEAGLCISALAISTVPKRLTTPNKGFQYLPDLGNVTIGLNYDKNSLTPASKKLLDYLRKGFSQSRQHQSINNSKLMLPDAYLV